MIYDSSVEKIGEDVEAFLKEKMLILFNDDAPDELVGIALIHKKSEMKCKITVGDYFILGMTKFKILKVGKTANETLYELGHCTIKFGKPNDNDLPGVVVVEDIQPPHLSIGMNVQFKRNRK